MNFEKKNNIYKTVMVILITALVTFLVTTIGFYNYYMRTNKGKIKYILKNIETSDVSKNIESKIEIIKAILQQYYMGDLNEEDMIEGAVKGYVEGLGESYTEYMTADEYQELLTAVNGSYVGIGIYMTLDNNDNVLVLFPIEGSPAEEQEIKTGDIISKINGEECNGQDLDMISNKIQGESGTIVELEIVRNGETIKKTIERRKVELKYIYSKVLENNIGYIQMLSFDENCTAKFKEEFDKLKEQNIKSLIIDLRNNGGGVVDEATAMSELFVPKDNVIMYSYDKENNENVVKSSNSNPIDMKVVVLVNENSASATEIFAAALEDNGLCKIVGQKTYGKGVMQEIIPFEFGGALKVTIKEFKRPNKEAINETGITPDEIVELSQDDKTDTQLNKAIEIIKQ